MGTAGRPEAKLPGEAAAWVEEEARGAAGIDKSLVAQCKRNFEIQEWRDEICSE